MTVIGKEMDLQVQTTPNSPGVKQTSVAPMILTQNAGTKRKRHLCENWPFLACFSSNLGHNVRSDGDPIDATRRIVTPACHRSES